jgi:hypothetical protein
MKHILDKLPGNELITNKLGDIEQQKAILEQFRKCKIVFSYAREDWPFVEEVAKALKIYFPKNNTFIVEHEHDPKKRDLPNIFCYTTDGKAYQWIERNREESSSAFNSRNNEAASIGYNQILGQSNVFVLFTYKNKMKSGPECIAGAGRWQTGEFDNWNHTSPIEGRAQFKIDFERADDSLDRDKNWKAYDVNSFSNFESISADAYDLSSAQKVAEKIIRKLLFNQSPSFYLPISSVFSYEKDIVELYQEIPHIINHWLIEPDNNEFKSLILKLFAYLNQGVPLFWPSVARQADFKQTTSNTLTDDSNNEIGSPRIGLDMLWPSDSRQFVEKNKDERQPDMVIAAALSKYHRKHNCISCMLSDNFSFPEAGPRRSIYATTINNVAIVVSGGIAPGINAVIDGIVRRHKKYNENVRILGINNGFYTLSQWNRQFIEELLPKDTSAKVTEGGSCLQTCRQKELLPSSENQVNEVENIVSTLTYHGIKILYVIGGDGSMRAAHQIAQACRKRAQIANGDLKISVVSIPKTMDNDILWVWQTLDLLQLLKKHAKQLNIWRQK